MCGAPSQVALYRLATVPIIERMTKAKGNHGGKRPGAGRPRGARSKSTLEKVRDTALQLAVLEDNELTMLARDRVPELLALLVKIARDPGVSGAARVNAAQCVIAYAFGRPRLRAEASGSDAPEWGAPLQLVGPGDPDFEEAEEAA